MEAPKVDPAEVGVAMDREWFGVSRVAVDWGPQAGDVSFHVGAVNGLAVMKVELPGEAGTHEFRLPPDTAEKLGAGLIGAGRAARNHGT